MLGILIIGTLLLGLLCLVLTVLGWAAQGVLAVLNEIEERIDRRQTQRRP